MPPGRAVLIVLMAMWVLGFVAFLGLHLREAIFQTYMGALAAVYGIALIVFRKDAADMMRWQSRLQFSSPPNYRPGFIAFIGLFFCLFGIGMFAAGVGRI